MNDIILRGQVMSNQSIYLQRGKMRFMKKKAKDLKEKRIQEVKEQRPRGVTGKDLEIEVKLYHGDRRVHDIDNFGKIFLDCMTGIIYDDDRQIYKMTIEKFYDKEFPRVVIGFRYYTNNGKSN